MNKLSTGITLLALSISMSVNAESFTAKNSGQGFTSLTHDFTSSLSNPALLTKFDDDDDAYVSLNFGIIAADEYEVIDTGERIADSIDMLDQNIDNIVNVPIEDIPDYYANLASQVDNIVTELSSIDNKPVHLREGINALIIIPNQLISMGVFVNQYGRFGGIADYVPTDEGLLNQAIITGDLDTNELLSEAIGVGYSVSEAGVMLGYELINHVNYDMSIGGKVKYQRLDLFYNAVKIANFDEDDFDLTDDEFLTDSNGINLDLGMYVSFGDNRQWQAALVINNLASQDVTLVEQDLTFDLDTSASIGLSYQVELFTFSAEMDLTDRAGFKQLQAPKYASIGAAVDLWQHVQFRLGARTDLNDEEADLYTVGIGISPWDIIALDIAAFTGDNDNVGAALQLSVKI